MQLHAGNLTAHGYSGVARLSAAERKAALRRAAREHGWLHIVRKLNALYVLNKYKHPWLASRFRVDRMYASAQYAKLT